MSQSKYTDYNTVVAELASAEDRTGNRLLAFARVLEAAEVQIGDQNRGAAEHYDGRVAGKRRGKNPLEEKYVEELAEAKRLDRDNIKLFRLRNGIDWLGTTLGLETNSLKLTTKKSLHTLANEVVAGASAAENETSVPGQAIERAVLDRLQKGNYDFTGVDIPFLDDYPWLKNAMTAAGGAAIGRVAGLVGMGVGAVLGGVAGQYIGNMSEASSRQRFAEMFARKALEAGVIPTDEGKVQEMLNLMIPGRSINYSGKRGDPDTLNMENQMETVFSNYVNTRGPGSVALDSAWRRELAQRNAQLAKLLKDLSEKDLERVNLEDRNLDLKRQIEEHQERFSDIDAHGVLPSVNSDGSPESSDQTEARKQKLLTEIPELITGFKKELANNCERLYDLGQRGERSGKIVYGQTNPANKLDRDYDSPIVAEGEGVLGELFEEIEDEREKIENVEKDIRAHEKTYLDGVQKYGLSPAVLSRLPQGTVEEKIVWLLNAMERSDRENIFPGVGAQTDGYKNNNGVLLEDSAGVAVQMNPIFREILSIPNSFWDTTVLGPDDVNNLAKAVDGGSGNYNNPIKEIEVTSGGVVGGFGTSVNAPDIRINPKFASREDKKCMNVDELLKYVAPGGGIS